MMKKMIGAMLCMLVGLLAYTCSTATVLAADWVLYHKSGIVELYYSPSSIGYYHDGLGETPFLKVRIKSIIKWPNQPPQAEETNMMLEGMRFEVKEWRLEQAINQWKQKHGIRR